MDERIESLLKFFEESARSTTDFVLEQAPLVAREIVAWEFYGGITNMVLCPLVILLVAFLIYRFLPKVCAAWSCSGDCDGNLCVAVGGVIGLFLCAGVLFGCTITFCNSTERVIKASMAPRLVILDYVKSATK